MFNQTPHYATLAASGENPTPSLIRFTDIPPNRHFKDSGTRPLDSIIALLTQDFPEIIITDTSTPCITGFEFEKV